MSEPVFSEELKRVFYDNGKKSLYRKDQIVQSTDDTLLLRLITKGFIKRYLIANDGSLGVQSIYGPGDIFSLTYAFKILLNQSIYAGPEVYYYETMSDVELYTLDNEILHSKMKENPLLYKDFFSQAGRRLESNIHRLENLTLQNSYKRVAHQLAYLARDFGEKTSTGICINVPLTHLDIANVLSITRETVSISVAQLRSNGLIKTGKKIVVPDLDKLEEEAHS